MESMLRHDEEFAKETFSRFLRRQGEQNFFWLPGAEPPDYFMQVAEEKFGVEVTQVMESVELGKGKIPYQGVRQALKSFARELEERMKQGCLQGMFSTSVRYYPYPSNARRCSKLASITSSEPRMRRLGNQRLFSRIPMDHSFKSRRARVGAP